MALNVRLDEFLVELGTYKQNCEGCEYLKGMHGEPQSHHVAIQCAVWDGVSAVVEGCPGPRKEEEKK